MTLAVVRTRAIVGLEAPETLVTVHVEDGHFGVSITGAPESAVRALRERLRSAFIASDVVFPSNKHIHVDLAPLPGGEHLAMLDLPIAIGIVAALGRVSAESLERVAFVGELSPSGGLQSIRGALMLALAARHDRSPRMLVLPEMSASEAALVLGVEVRSARTLAEVIKALQSADPAHALARAIPLPLTPISAPLDLRDVRGQAPAKRALEIAAAGAHHVLLGGPGGVVKSLLAQRIGGLLPPMAEHEAYVSAAVTSLAGDLDPSRWKARPFCLLDGAQVAASSTALHERCALAYGGVLFVEGLGALPDTWQDTLAKWLLSGRIEQHSGSNVATFPLRFQLMATQDADGAPAHARDQPVTVAKHALGDCFDVRVAVSAAAHAHLCGAPDGDTSATIAARVAAARERQVERQGCPNAALVGAAVKKHCALDAVATKLLVGTVARFGLSARAAERVLKVARTIADLTGRDAIASLHVAEAIGLQRLAVGE